MYIREVEVEIEKAKGIGRPMSGNGILWSFFRLYLAPMWRKENPLLSSKKKKTPNKKSKRRKGKQNGINK